MSSPITTGSLAKLLWPGVNEFFMTKYNDHKEQWTELFEQYKSKRNFEEDVAMTDLGLLAEKAEGAPITYDTVKQGYTKRYQHTVYGLGFIITREMVEDDLYGMISKKKASALARSARHTKEIIAANVYNRAFNTSYLGGDGKALLVSDHPNVTGGTYSNILSTAANLSEAALEQACIDIRKYVDDRGLRIKVMPQKLILPVDLEFEAERILRSPARVGTTNNDLNALKEMGKFPGGVVLNNFLTSTTAWFIRTDVEDGMKFFQRRGMEFTTDNDWSTENAMFKVTERYSLGWSDPKGLYGTPGV
jgi:hypothetical protein